MKALPFSSWPRKKFIQVYLAVSVGLVAALAPIAYRLLLSPDELRPWSPSYEESYWTPAQVQLATERLAADVAALRLGSTNIASVRVRLAILQSKLSEERADSDVGRMFANVQGFADMVEALDTFIKTTEYGPF